MRMVHRGLVAWGTSLRGNSSAGALHHYLVSTSSLSSRDAQMCLASAAPIMMRKGGTSALRAGVAQPGALAGASCGLSTWRTPAPRGHGPCLVPRRVPLASACRPEHLCRSSLASSTSSGSFNGFGSVGGDAEGCTPLSDVASGEPATARANPEWRRTLSAQENAQMKRELHSLNVAIVSNIAIMVAKVWAHLISGSSAMLAESLHSLADVLNQVLLRVGVVKALKAPTARHPYGHMRDRFVWSLISAVGIFFLGAGASVLHGLHMLFEARVIEGAYWSYVVLAVSGLLEGYSLWVAASYVIEGAKARGMSFLQYVRSGVDPTTVAVMLEDGGAVAGLGIAAVCTALTHATGNAMYDALGSIAVGGLLGFIAIFLVAKNRDLLLGRSMSDRELEEILALLRKDPVVLYVSDVKSEELGPRTFRLKAEIAWDANVLVERYLARCGKDKLAARLAAALELELGRQQQQQQLHHGADASSTSPAPWAAGGPLLSSSSSSGVQVVPAEDLVGVLKSFGRDIINVVGAEVDRLELEIQAVNTGVLWVDLETDRVPMHYRRAATQPSASGGPGAGAGEGGVGAGALPVPSPAHLQPTGPPAPVVLAAAGVSHRASGAQPVNGLPPQPQLLLAFSDVHSGPPTPQVPAQQPSQQQSRGVSSSSLQHLTDLHCMADSSCSSFLIHPPPEPTMPASAAGTPPQDVLLTDAQAGVHSWCYDHQPRPL